MDLLLILLGIDSSIIKSPLVPLCKHCVHFKSYNYIDNKDDDYKYSLGKCQRFSKTSETTGKVIYSHAFLCRNDETLCGYEGRGFVEKKDETFVS